MPLKHWLTNDSKYICAFILGRHLDHYNHLVFYLFFLWKNHNKCAQPKLVLSFLASMTWLHEVHLKVYCNNVVLDLCCFRTGATTSTITDVEELWYQTLTFSQLSTVLTTWVQTSWEWLLVRTIIRGEKREKCHLMSRDSGSTQTTSRFIHHT